MVVKDESLKDVLSRLSKRTTDHMQFGSDVTIERLPTPSLGINRAMNGGWAMGRQVMVWGPKSAGKSSFMMQQFAVAQRLGKVCALFDAERAFDPAWATRLGVDTDRLIYAKGGTINDMVNTGRDLMDAGVDVIGVDSISSIMPGTYIEKDGELKDFENTGAIGGLSRSLSAALSQLNYANRNDTLWLFISQIRMAQKGSHYWGASPTGGKAVEHGMSQSIRMFASEAKDSLIMGEVASGDRIIQKGIGRKVQWTVDKDRVSPGMGSEGDYLFYFDGDRIGIDNVSEVLSLAVEYGVIERAGAWYKFGGDNIGQGEINATNKIAQDEELYNAIRSELNV